MATAVPAADEDDGGMRAWEAHHASGQRPKPSCAGDSDQSGYQMLNVIIGSRYHLFHGLGRGKYGRVYEAFDVHTSEHVGVKVMNRIDLHGTRQKKAEREWIVASKLSHPNIVQLRDVQVSETHVFLVMELASGGELFERISRCGGVSEDQARVYFQQILSGIHYCHSQGVFHRDLKLENLLMSEVGSNQVKIMDFGLSKDSTMSNPKTYCGTISYMAPEVTNLVAGKAVYDGSKADIWSLGVILYVMVCCAYPFGHDGKPELAGESARVVYSRIRSRTFKDPAELSSCCSSDLQDLIKGMLTVDCSSRLSIEGMLRHNWMKALPTGPVDLGGRRPPPELKFDWPPLKSSLADTASDAGSYDGDGDGDGSDMEEDGNDACSVTSSCDGM